MVGDGVVVELVVGGDEVDGKIGGVDGNDASVVVVADDVVDDSDELVDDSIVMGRIVSVGDPLLVLPSALI